MTERGPAMVRIALFSLLFGAFALALVQPVSAGTGDDPEVTDPAGDGQAGLAAGNRDLTKVYIQDALVDGTDLVFAADLAADIQQTSSFHSIQERIRIAFVPTNPGGLPAGAVEAYVNIRLGFIQQGAPAESAACSFGTTTTVGGSRGVSQEVAGTAAFTPGHYECRIPASLIGSFDPAQHVITGLYAQFQLVQRGPLSGTIPDDPAGVNVLRTYDRAPDSGAGRDFPAGPVGNGTGNQTAGDSDNDGLNDTCEQQYFGGLNSTHNGTGDADGDGLTNQHECDLGTDPTQSDTDGDGVNDKDDEFPVDPTQGGTSGNTTSSSSSSSTSSSSTSSSGSSGTGSTSRSGTDAQADEVRNLGDAVDKLESDLDYLGTSAGGMAAVLLLAILALAVRWSL